jgi:hypothetical protein
MKRFLLLFSNELKLFRTAIPVHLVAVFQPTIMFLLMSVILVHPTFDMYMTQPITMEGRALAAAMGEVGSPIGEPYISLHLVEDIQPATGQRQVVNVEEKDGKPAAVQRFGLIDSNMVKNYRNRLTAAALQVWNDALMEQAVTVIERPWLPHDVSYLVYFGMAMLPISTALGASVLGGILTAQEFENGMVLEARLSPIASVLILGARITRLTLFGLLGAGCTFLALGWRTSYWPDSLWLVLSTLLPVAIIYGCIGVIAGLHFRRTIPAFLIGLVVSMVGWLLGSAFGLSGGFSIGYAFISRLTPNTHAVELIFPQFFCTQVGNPLVSTITLIGMVLGMLGLTFVVYQKHVRKQVS